MDRRMIKPVRRCLFGRPTNGDFLQTQKRLEKQEMERFKRRWNLDGVENEIEWTKPDAGSIPEFYVKEYSQQCRRRAVRPCVGKSLSFADSDHEDEVIDETVRAPSPVQYCGDSTVEVFIGFIPYQSRQAPHTPTKNDFGRGDSHTTKSESTQSDASGYTPMKSDFGGAHTAKSENSDATESVVTQVIRRNFKQRRLTDMWRSLKRRQRPVAAADQLLHKRARIGRV